MNGRTQLHSRIRFKLIVISGLGRAETLQKKCWQRNA